jgi:uncharacterized protein
MRVVLDTNVLVSGLLWGGPPNQLLRWARDGILQAICCPEVIQEVSHVLAYPRLSRRLEALGCTGEQALAYLLNLMRHVPSPKHIPAVLAEDPSDDLFLALAEREQALLTVSGNRHLLDLVEYAGIQVVSPAEAVGVVGRLPR